MLDLDENLLFSGTETQIREKFNMPHFKGKDAIRYSRIKNGYRVRPHTENHVSKEDRLLEGIIVHLKVYGNTITSDGVDIDELTVKLKKKGYNVSHKKSIYGGYILSAES